MNPMFLEDFERAGARGAYADVFRGMRAAGAAVPGILYLFAHRSQVTRHLANYTQGVMRGPSPLSPGFRELIAAYTSKLNQCSFCIRTHAAVAAELLGDRALVDAVLADPGTAPIPEKEKTLLAFVARVNGSSFALRRDEVEAVKSAGWREEAIYDAVSVCALFNFYNRWCDGAGVQPLKADDYVQSGKRLATHGYLPPDE